MGEVSGDQTVLKVPQRTIPMPTTISPEAQTFLARGLPIMPPEIPHTDKPCWRDYTSPEDRELLGEIAGFLARHLRGG